MNALVGASTVLFPWSFCIAAAIAGDFVVVSTELASATEQSVTSVLKLDVPFNVKWDRCESLARQRGAPPGKPAYGAFIENCMGKGSRDASRVTGRAAGTMP
jgi:hypothetical protein